MNTEERLSVALHALGDKDSAGSAPIGDLVWRGRRRRHDRVIGRSVAAATALAAVGVTAALGLGGGTTGHHGTTNTHRVELVAAAKATSDTSFRFRFTADGFGSSHRIVCRGGVDRDANVGWERDSTHETRVIGGTEYVKIPGKPWRAEPGALDGAFDCTVSITHGSLNPEKILESLRDKGKVRYVGRRGSGEDAVDVYAYAYSAKNGQLKYRGEIQVGVGSGYVQKVTNQLTFPGGSGTQTIEYSHFGEPVRVSAP